jgi:hypothetical protein
MDDEQMLTQFGYDVALIQKWHLRFHLIGCQPAGKILVIKKDFFREEKNEHIPR